MRSLNPDRNLWPLFGVLFLDGVGAGILMPVLPFVAIEYHVSPLAVTALVAIFSGFSAIGGMFLGWLADRLPRRLVLMGALTTMAASYVGMCLVPGYWPILAMRALSGLAAGNTAVVQSIIANAATDERRPSLLGKAGAATAAGILAGPIFVGLSALNPWAISTTKLAFYIATLFAALALGLAVFDLVQRRAEGSETRGDRLRRPSVQFQIRTRESREALAVILVYFLGTVAFAAPLSISALWSYDVLGWGAAKTGALIALATASLAATQLLLFPFLVGKLGAARTFAIGPLMIATGLFLCPASHLEIFFWIGHAIAASGFGILAASAPTLISSFVPEHSRGSWLGASEAGRSIGQCVGPLAAGWAFQAVSHDFSYFQAGGIALVALAAAVLQPIIIKRGTFLTSKCGVDTP